MNCSKHPPSTEPIKHLPSTLSRGLSFIYWERKLLELAELQVPTLLIPNVS